MMNIAFLGTGLLGFPMAERLLKAGHNVFVYNRTKSKTKLLESQGAQVFADPSKAVYEASVVILVLSDIKAIEAVLLKGCGKVLAEKTVIQMGTIGPKDSRWLQGKVVKLGGNYFECPVLGSRNEAQQSNLILMVGSNKSQFKKWSSVLKAFGSQVHYVGDVGQAAALKLALNHLIASHAVGFSLSLGIVQKNKIHVDIFMDILRKSSLYAPMFDKKLSHWLNRRYSNANFPVKHLLKDVRLICDEAKDKDFSADVIDAIRDLLTRAVKSGLADQDYSAIFKTITKN